MFDMRDSGARPQGIATAADALRQGALVAMPTETVYGLAADATNPAAVNAIFLAKGRPRFNPLIVHLESREAAGRVARFGSAAERLAERFWPGPLTLVLQKHPGSGIADAVTAGLDTIAVRVPASPVAQELITAAGVPLAAPSANRSGRLSPTTAAAVAEEFGDAVAVTLDAGPTPVGLESTIVGFEGKTARLLRAGGLPRTEIEAVIGQNLAGPGAGVERPAAPGMLASHYAPNARLRLSATRVERGEALLAFGPTMPDRADEAVAIVNLSERGDLGEAASRFFAALRKLDRRADVIAVAPIPDEGLGEAINDRLRRAAAPRERSASGSDL